MTDWQSVDHPFKDPSNPDIGVETELWKGGPRPQAEVQYPDADLTISGRSYKLGSSTNGVPSLSTPSTLLGAGCPACKAAGKSMHWDYDNSVGGWRCSECGIMSGPVFPAVRSPDNTLTKLVDQVNDDINSLMIPRVLKRDITQNIPPDFRDPRHPISPGCVCVDPIGCTATGKCLAHEPWTRSNWSAAPATNFVMDFSPRNYVMSAAPIYRLPISLPIMQQFRSWLVGRLDSLAAWLQP